jgi:hypothetical protein
VAAAQICFALVHLLGVACVLGGEGQERLGSSVIGVSNVSWPGPDWLIRTSSRARLTEYLENFPPMAPVDTCARLLISGFL